MTPFRRDNIGFLVGALLGEASIFAYERSGAHPAVSATIGVAPLIVNRYYLLWHNLYNFTLLDSLHNYSSCRLQRAAIQYS
jgi:hypothetical protein